MKIAYYLPTNSDALAPLFVDDGGEILRAVLQLDCRTGQVTYDVGDQLADDEVLGHVFRWTVPSNVLGCRLESIAHELMPQLQRVLDGYMQELDTDYAELGDDAQRARAYIQHRLSEETFVSEDLATVWTADELAERAEEISADLTDDEIDKLAEEYSEHYSEDGLILGCVSEAFRERRDAS
ncbi:MULTISPECIES: hypothetical protein [Bradyrhizobium]|uniref:hypothetical protein n=1 Tax=Bradyrhizobium TaxID=374 RepID=UPI001EDAB852|nr:hypothetical protein [Bradyrhizobium zhengyangense]MCG2645192.1 hypothetical protein [Bradyrhizobium zhengyangense]